MYWTRKIALTGGPCGGKTSAMNYLHDTFRQWGFTVYMTPEAFTVTAQGQAAELYGKLQKESQMEFCKLGTQISTLAHFMEEYFEGLASLSKNPSVIFCDRGLCDTKAYYPPAVWDMTLNRLNISDKQALERYLGVLHLATTAKGAQNFYNTSNNAARRESALEAIEVDDKILNSWKNHKRLVYVGNEGVRSFEAKLENVRNIAEGLLELPGGNQTRIKAKVTQTEQFQDLIGQQKQTILEQYPIINRELKQPCFVQKLLGKDGNIKYKLGVNMQGQNGKTFYIYNTITEKQYNDFEKLDPISKTHIVYLKNGKGKNNEKKTKIVIEEKIKQGGNTIDVILPVGTDLPSYIQLI